MLQQGESPTSEKSEVFALGYSLYHILTRGGRPNLQALHRLANELPVRFSDRLSDALKMCLDPNPTTRATAQQVYDFLVARRHKSTFIIKPARVMEFEPLTTPETDPARQQQDEQQYEEELTSL